MEFTFISISVDDLVNSSNSKIISRKYKDLDQNQVSWEQISGFIKNMKS